MAEIPKRAVQFRLEVGADSRRALADVLFNLAIQIDHEGLSSHSVSGGYDSGYEQWLTMSDGPTHDGYVAQLNAWLEQNKTA